LYSYRNPSQGVSEPLYFLGISLLAISINGVILIATGTSIRDKITGMLFTAADSFMLVGGGGFMVLHATALNTKINKNKKRLIISLKQQLAFEMLVLLWFEQ